LIFNAVSGEAGAWRRLKTGSLRFPGAFASHRSRTGSKSGISGKNDGYSGKGSGE
jgi:hypothetical protein